MDAKTLAEVMGGNADYARFAGPFTEAMEAAGCNTVRRAAMFCAQIGHESAGLRYMEEIASGAAYEGRSDLGNTRPGDGKRFKGSGPIQLTGRNNFRAFTRWAHSRGLTNIDFEQRPELVREDPRWGFLAATWYWTVARPQINAMCDAGDLNGVTRAINGGLNGFQDRKERYERALRIGQRLLEKMVQPIEKVLEYDAAHIKQDTFYWCGPATAQTIINSGGKKFLTEQSLAAEMKTTTDGTNTIDLVADSLRKHLPHAGYAVRQMPNDPPSDGQKNQLWADITGSINAGFGVAANIVAPPNNYPRPSYKSTQAPRYNDGDVYHYVSIMGYAVDTAGVKHVFVVDSGFDPYVYWCTFEQMASLIPPKGYAYSTASPKGENSMYVTEKFFRDFITGYLGPVIDSVFRTEKMVKDIQIQLRGEELNGWPQLGQNQKGQDLTPVDAIGALRHDVANLRAVVEKRK